MNGDTKQYAWVHFASAEIARGGGIEQAKVVADRLLEAMIERDRNLRFTPDNIGERRF